MIYSVYFGSACLYIYCEYRGGDDGLKPLKAKGLKAKAEKCLVLL